MTKLMLDSTSSRPTTETPVNPVPTVFEAIVKQLCLKATYNRDWVVLAPHVLYTKHGEIYVDAVTVARNGMLPRETKMGTFKVAGLAELTLTGRTFDISEKFEPEAERYADVTLMAVERPAG